MRVVNPPNRHSYSRSSDLPMQVVAPNTNRVVYIPDLKKERHSFKEAGIAYP